MNNDINARVEQIIRLYESKGNPQQIMQNMLGGSNLGQVQTKLQNISQGRSPKEFLLQVARQNGVSEQNLQGLSRILSGN